MSFIGLFVYNPITLLVMGYYTELKLAVVLSEKAPLDIIKKLCDGTMKTELFTAKFGEVPGIYVVGEVPELPIEHDFGKSKRWCQIFNRATFDETTRELRINCDIKAYDSIYDHLVDWLKPFIEIGSIKSKGEDQDTWDYHL